jgi:hypothetical protein
MPGMANTMHEWKAGQLHSGSKNGPIVKSQKQAIAIGLDEDRRGMAMGGMVPPGRQAQNRAIHASRPSAMPGPAMRSPMPMPAPMPRPAPMPMPQPMPGMAPGYLGRYPAMPPRMAGGGEVGQPPANYYAQGGMAGEADVSTANGPVLPNMPSMQQPQGVGYAMGGEVYPDPQPQLNMPLGTDQQIMPPGPERVKVKGPKGPMKSPKKPGRSERVAKFEKENGDREV